MSVVRVTIRRGGVLPASSPIPKNNLCRPTTALFRRREQIPNPADAPIIDPLDVFAGSKNYTPSIPDYSKVTGQYASRAYQLNQRLNELLFDALQLDIVTRTQLATQPFVVLKQMK
jgi:hypothetical protein